MVALGKVLTNNPVCNPQLDRYGFGLYFTLIQTCLKPFLGSLGFTSDSPHFSKFIQPTKVT